MPKRSSSEPSLDHVKAAEILETQWRTATTEASAKIDLCYVEDVRLCEMIRASVNHKLVAYRFCLPVQLLGKLTDPSVDASRLQKRRGDPSDVTSWDARSLAKRVVAPFNRREEGILGPSDDPYVGNPMRIPRMVRDDRSKKDVTGWNVLVEILERIESEQDSSFATAVFRQVLLEMFRRQQSLRFLYSVPPRISLEGALKLAADFLQERSGGDRALALCGALFDAIGMQFGLYAAVNRARINASDEASGQAADLECVNSEGKVVLAVEVKDRTLTLADVEGTLRKSRQREINDIFFTTPAVKPEDEAALKDRVQRAFAAGQNFYVFDFFELARSVLALGGEDIRTTFLCKVGEHLNTWSTQPAHRQAWKKLLETA